MRTCGFFDIRKRHVVERHPVIVEYDARDAEEGERRVARSGRVGVFE